MYYEDFEIDQTIVTRSRMITGTDIDLFATMTGAVNPLFLSDRAAQQAGRHARMTPGPLLFSLTIGLCYQAGLFDHVIAMAGVNNMSFLASAHPGDSITAYATPVEMRLSKKKDRGVVVLKQKLKNQRGEDVLVTDVTYLMGRR